MLNAPVHNACIKLISIYVLDYTDVTCMEQKSQDRKEEMNRHTQEQKKQTGTHSGTIYPFSLRRIETANT